MRGRRGWHWICVTAGAALLAGTVPAAPAPAPLARSDQDCRELVHVITGHDQDGNPEYGWEVHDRCATSTSSGTGSGGDPYPCRHSTRGEMPCQHQVWGWWNNWEECYARLLEPQPPPGDPLWEGHDPVDGAVYQFHCPGDTLGSGGGQHPGEIRTGFRADTPGLPSVSQLAQRAMASLPLVGPDIGTAPGPDGAGLVGMPVWLWTGNTAQTWGPVRVSVPGPGITVTAEGNATRIAWDMGDGHTVVCDGPGRPYRNEYGVDEPDCGHVYAAPSRRQPDGRYRITAATTWHVVWWVEPRGSGAEGEDYYLRQSATSVQVNELQVVTS